MARLAAAGRITDSRSADTSCSYSAIPISFLSWIGPYVLAGQGLAGHGLRARMCHAAPLDMAVTACPFSLSTMASPSGPPPPLWVTITALALTSDFLIVTVRPTAGVADGAGSLTSVAPT